MSKISINGGNIMTGETYSTLVDAPDPLNLKRVSWKPVSSSWIAAVTWIRLTPAYRSLYPGHGLLLVKTTQGVISCYLSKPSTYARIFSGASVGRVINRSILRGKAIASQKVN